MSIYKFNSLILFHCADDADQFRAWFRHHHPAAADFNALHSLPDTMRSYPSGAGSLALWAGRWYYSGDAKRSFQTYWREIYAVEPAVRRGLLPGRVFDANYDSREVANFVSEVFDFNEYPGSRWSGGDSCRTVIPPSVRDELLAMRELNALPEPSTPSVNERQARWADFDPMRLFFPAFATPVPVSVAPGTRYTSVKPPFRSHRKVRALALP